ncbi:MAG: LOG family protein, partial [Planctomycetota bacterium]
MAPDPRDERKRMQSFLAGMGFDYSDFRDRMLADICETMLRVRRSQHDEGQVRLMASAMREMWYAYHVFHGWEDVRKVSIFGSARTPEEHPDYLAAVEFSRLMAEQGWMSITGAGDGIMKAGHEGPSRERSFGLSIRLPFETSANEVIEGDPKLINFRYFFTRKLMFVDHAEAIVGFPGGFGTMDEVFESLVLIQTGKSPIVPVVLVEGQDGDFWQRWEDFTKGGLLEEGWISPEDPGLYRIVSSPEEAVEEITSFYRVYQSARYVHDKLVLRLTRALTEQELAVLNDEFSILIESG